MTTIISKPIPNITNIDSNLLVPSKFGPLSVTGDGHRAGNLAQGLVLARLSRHRQSWSSPESSRPTSIRYTPTT